ncbi:transcription factor HHO1-like [Tripterygium wilfordii]|uniref:transcription factor HHO1-like n=1 Tax=Tripterygium wilfordii TaxID=458696 RepID=UPI0018F834F8|nr:transcription factor HHO1-like [Tripterygium wilfordii]
MLGRSHNVMADYHLMPLTEPARKNNRRSWTTELSNSFITAVETLGGPEAATPSKIKKLMQVEGLTTDQVKSHLQKYRHQSRRASQPNENPVNLPIDFQEQWICESFPVNMMVPNSSDVHSGASHNIPGHESKNAESSAPDIK